MEKLSLSLNEAVLKLKMVSEPALDRWTKSLNGAISGELLEYFDQRIRLTLSRIDHGFAAELIQVRPYLGSEEPAPQAVLLDRKEYRLEKDELAESYEEQVCSSDFEVGDKQAVKTQVNAFIRILEDSIAVNLIPALFNIAEELERERRSIGKTLNEAAEALERGYQRLASDMNDVPGQALFNARLQADILEGPVLSAEAGEELACLNSILRRCLHELQISKRSLQIQSMPQKDCELGRGNRINFSMPVSRQLTSRVAPAAGQKDQVCDRLTPREKEVWRLLSNGASNAEISRELFVSESTVKFHIRNIFCKLGAKNRVEAAKIAYRSTAVQ